MRARSIQLLISFLLLSISTIAQINLTETSNSYTENFNSLTAGGTWTDNSTLVGWYSNRTTYVIGTGSSNTGALYSFGASSATDRCLGSLGSGSTSTIYYGVRLKNNGSSTISAITISYTGEQWRNGSTTSNTLTFSYATSSSALTSITAGSHVNYSTLNFISPNLSGPVGALDGNQSANKTQFSSVTITVSIPAGSEIMLRWADPDDASSDQGIGVDDLTVTATYPCTPPTATIAGTTTICSGNSTNILFSGTPNAVVTYNVNGGTNTTVTLDGSGTATVNTGTLSANATYNLVSASAGSCSQSLVGSAVVTVNSLPTAAISGTTTICSGSAASITFSGTPNAIVTYNVNGGTNTTVTLDGSGTATVSTGTISANTVYTLVSVSAGICSQVLSGSATVTVNTLPTASVSGTTSVCSGTDANVVFNGTPNAVVTYNVNGGANTTVTLDGSGTATVNTGVLSANATYDLVSVTDGSCAQALSGSVTITVNALPTAAITGTTTICAGSNSNIVFSGTANAVVTYNIDGGSNLTIALDASGNATISTGNINVTTVYNILDVNDGTCTASLSGNATVTVNALPAATISGSATICEGANTDIFFTGTPNAVITYNIDGGGNITTTLDGSGNAVVNTGPLSAGTTYNIVAVNLNSCVQALSGSAVIAVTPIPTASISGSTAICSGQSTTIVLTGTANASVDITVNGVPQNVGLDGMGNAMINSGTLTSTTSYDLVNISLSGCGQSLTGNATVTVNPLPTAGISGGTMLCSGTATNISFNGTPNSSVVYTVNGGTNQVMVLDGSGNGMLNTGNLLTTMTYSLVSVSDMFCTDNLTGSAVVNVTPIPTASISGSTTICNGTNANILFTGTPMATVSYTINGSSGQTVTLDAMGSASINTGTLLATTTYGLVDVSLNSCSASVNGSAVVTVGPALTATIIGSTLLSPGNITDILFTGTPNATVSYTVNNGPVQTIVLDGSGNATLNTGVLYYDAVYSLLGVSLGCTQAVSGTATVTMTIGYGPIYTYTNAPSGAFNYVAMDASGVALALYNGTIMSSTPCAAGFTTEGYNSGSVFDENTNRAVVAKVTPANLHRLIITGFNVGIRRSAGGPQSVRLAYSLNNGATWINSGVNELPNNSTCDNITTVAWSTLPFQVISTTDGIMFAVFGFDAASVNGQLQILNLNINGAVIETPLPITLTNFNGHCIGGDLELSWKVANEDNIRSYVLKRSVDGKNYVTVADVESRFSGTYYHTIYNAPDALYCLSCLATDGSEYLSDVLNVRCGGKAESMATTVSVAGQTLHIRPGTEFNGGEAIGLQVYNMNGQLILNSERVLEQQIDIKVPFGASGIYLVRIVQGKVSSSHKIFAE